MPRHMSFSLTTEQMRARTKTVTRRVGWKFLKPGDKLVAVVKSQGLKLGEHPQVIARLRVKSVRAEKLDAMILRPSYGKEECRLEGFPDIEPAEFVTEFAASHGCGVHDEVTRIEFDYLD